MKVVSALKFDGLKVESNGKECSIKIQRIGQEHCAPTKVAEQRATCYFSFHVITHGQGYFKCGDETVCLGKGNAFILWPGVECQYYPMEIDPWSYIWVDFYGEDLEDLLNACGLSPDKPILRKFDYTKICDIMKQLYEGYDGRDEQDLVCYANLMLLFGNLMNSAKRYQRTNDKYASQFRQFRDILIYINNNFRMNLTLAQIGEEMFLTEKQIISLFKYNMGMTPIDYINKFKISTACNLLKRKDCKIQEIAKMVGIEDEKYFMRLFKKITGMSTSEYRKNCEDVDPFLWLKEKGLDFI